ncbi:30S ribosomal protein S13 [Candidatus Woesearchaeota archaeon CG08_land_8_20_14_0_20_47_9]|nr:MAG: 30S ribosomal protein S13 [Candidatus Woesearchaeota archaeon CG1_02_47_18]PIN72351.1 MAG: 30S ribosomal protein S13 [Candidatus Woesearchaeota archaeon CG10_big_fil_rev_8_21_14_0_10_47_5]PIO04313.1 MAG: 30S ribosomal protein S13 [Candidatus Woesearchaeota archaeon CG08_land_8_20_14_0_20_47_9]HII30129.1 30S ribosomal protein S13 [Candidatus Woesearchaeota archaeon]
MEADDKNFRHLIRVANTDLKGEKSISNALHKIKGIGFAIANLVCKESGVDPAKKVGLLSDEEIKRIDEVIANIDLIAPPWIMNRRKDPAEGRDRHLIISDLKFAVENDVRMMKKIKCYKGMRHAFGLPVRGQRTRSNFRKNKGRGPGVLKKKDAKGSRVRQSIR